MPRYKARTPTIEERIMSALRVARELGEGPLSVARLHTRPGLSGRRSPEIRAACEALVARGEVVSQEPDLKWGPHARQRLTRYGLAVQDNAPVHNERSRG